MNKEKLINYLNERLKNVEEQYNDKFYQDLQQYIKGEMDFIKILLNRLENGEFDNE
ncbi:hypothetical protein [Spiroplasma endosymbiont of Tricholauxania praeusta]|uniref:hypothetical protein n=1 Tax=Spiroplasma endosymbiont of Tricholauxania praeusta TaxID=3066296 RepID=UPI0030D26CD1